MRRAEIESDVHFQVLVEVRKGWWNPITRFLSPKQPRDNKSVHLDTNFLRTVHAFKEFSHAPQGKTSRDYRADKFLVTFFTLKDPKRSSGRFFFHAEREATGCVGKFATPILHIHRLFFPLYHLATWKVSHPFYKQNTGLFSL